MNRLLEIAKLIAAISFSLLLIYASLLAGQLDNPQNKYSHPITRPGITW